MSRPQKKRRFAKIACLCAAGLWLLLVLYLSCQSGEQTKSLSKWVARLIAWIFPQVKEHFTFGQFHYLVRKAAHVMLFLVLGAAAGAGAILRAKTEDVRKRAIAAAAVCTVIAAATEIAKIWIPGRHLNWLDAAINAVSAWCGAGLVMLAHRCRRKNLH